MIPLDFLVVGAGPAGLAAAIRYKQKNKRASVVVVDKAPRAGAHSLSGAVFEPACLDELVPGWRKDGAGFFSDMAAVKKDEMYFLTRGSAFRIPSVLVPPGMDHRADQVISLVRLVDWLVKAAVREGVEVHYGFSVASLVWEHDAVKGVRLVDQGRDALGAPKANFLAGETVLARTTVLADGACGVLSREYISRIGGNMNPQVYSIGVKQILRLPPGNDLGQGRVMHTLGFPAKPDVFGGGFLYGMSRDMAAVGLILGLDWRYQDFDPQGELEVFKAHPFMARFLKGAKVMEAGAKVIPEGGFFALPQLQADGVMLVGDAAGFVNMERIKGIHYGILSGMAAADTAAAGDLSLYVKALEARGVMRDMRHARNFRAVFQAGLFVGAPLSMVQSLWPWRIGMRRDHVHTGPYAYHASRQPGPGVIDRAGFAALSRTMHREDEPAHLTIPDAEMCRRCGETFQSPCTAFCPTEVYRRKGEGIHVSASNCVHCGMCAVKCPYQNITWIPPEGAQGPRYKLM